LLPVRSLSPDEAALWARVAATITPLSRNKVQEQQAEPAGPVAPVEPARPLRKPVAAPASRPAARPGVTLDGSWDRKLSAGAVQPDRVVDLHGMNLDGAWQTIDQALEDAIAAGDRVILLITGHHRPGDPPIVRGRIRAAVHDWLAVSRHAARIAAVRAAHPRHGGGGSLYLILRRR
jgi:DNA-nicking Smr family endonuclease